METKILKQEKNVFLERDELLVEIVSDKVPSLSELIVAMGKDEKVTVVRKINTNFGQQRFLAEVLVYDSVEARNKIEVIPKKIKKKMEADRKAKEEEEKKKAKAEQEAKAQAEAEAKEKVEEESKVEEVVEEKVEDGN